MSGIGHARLSLFGLAGGNIGGNSLGPIANALAYQSLERIIR